MKVRKAPLAAALGGLALMGAMAQGATVYENDAAGFGTAISGLPGSTINWDDVSVADGSYTTIPGSQYSALFGNPALSPTGGSLLVGDPANPSGGFFGADFYAVSGENVFSVDPPPTSPEGLLTITFSTPMTALGVWFLDVEGDYLGTGLTINGVDYRFSKSQGDNSQSFLGVVGLTPFTSAQIHMATAAASNGVGIDDVTYATAIPLPASVWGGVALMGFAALKRVRRQR